MQRNRSVRGPVRLALLIVVFAAGLTVGAWLLDFVMYGG
jgi:hypothetical protein